MSYSRRVSLVHVESGMLLLASSGDLDCVNESVSAPRTAESGKRRSQSQSGRAWNGNQIDYSKYKTAVPQLPQRRALPLPLPLRVRPRRRHHRLRRSLDCGDAGAAKAKHLPLPPTSLLEQEAPAYSPEAMSLTVGEAERKGESGEFEVNLSSAITTNTSSLASPPQVLMPTFCTVVPAEGLPEEEEETEKKMRTAPSRATRQPAYPRRYRNDPYDPVLACVFDSA